MRQEPVDEGEPLLELERLRAARHDHADHQRLLGGEAARSEHGVEKGAHVLRAHDVSGHSSHERHAHAEAVGDAGLEAVAEGLAGGIGQS